MKRPRRQPQPPDGENPFMRPGVMDHVGKVLSMLISQEQGVDIEIKFEKKEKDDDAG